MITDNAHRLPSAEIMVVEDDKADLRLLSDILTEAGYRVRPATDGELALLSAQAKPPDLILLDYKLPDMSGIEVCRRLKADAETGDIPVIFISALGGTELKVKALQGGAIDYVTKPYAAHEILARVKTHLDMYLLQQQLLEEIAKHERTEQALRESEAYTKTVLDNLPIGIAVNAVDPAVTFQYMNDRFLDYYRTSREALSEPDSFWEAVYDDPEFREEMKKTVLDDVASGLPERMHWTDVPITRKGEQTSFVTAQNVPLSGGSLMVSTVVDVTAPKLAKDALEKSRALLSSIIESPEDIIIFALDRSYNYLGFNAAHAREMKAVYGSDIEIGGHILDYIPHEGDRIQAVAAYERVLNGERFIDVQEYGLGEDRLWYELVYNPILSAREDIVGFCCYTTNVTDRRMAEIERESLLGDVRERMKELQCMYGVSSVIRQQDELDDVFRHAVSLIPPGWQYPDITTSRILIGDETYESDPFEIGQWKQSSGIVVRGLRHGSIEVFYTEERPDSDEGPFLAEERELLDGLARMLGETIEGKLDAQERAKIEEQLHQGQRMEPIGRLAGGVAHDFNNNLTVILNYATMLLERFEPLDPVHKDLSEIVKAADHAASLTQQLLAFSRREIISPRVIDLNALLAEGHKMLQRIIGEDIDLVFVAGGELDRIEADPGQMHQILMNLAVNARDAMPDGGKLTIETESVDLDEGYTRQHPDSTPGRYVMLAVSDTGKGMDQETQRQIFEPFFTTKDLGEGTGLGLSTVYGIVKRFEGSVEVYSEPGVGTTFKVYLPVTEREAAEIEPIADAASPQGRETILLVEDEDALRALAVRILEMNGYRVCSAANAGEALLLAQRHGDEIDLVLTDVIMPNMNGKECYEQLRKFLPELKVLYMSGYPEDALSHRGVLDEGTQFILKPFTTKGLADKVRKVLDG